MANTKIILQFVHRQHSIRHLRPRRTVHSVLPIVFLFSIFRVLIISSSIFEYDIHSEYIKIGSIKTMSGLMEARTGNQTSKKKEDMITKHKFVDDMIHKTNISVDIEETHNEIITTDDTIHSISDGVNGNKISLDSNQGSVIVIAVAPKDKQRLITLWSQLECFIEKKFQTIVIAAPDWARSANILGPFLEKAAGSIPHLNETNIITFYHLNDRYDVGLWCDSLIDKSHDIFNKHDNFVLVNDSLLAIRHFTGVLDMLQENNLTMTSLGYSLESQYWLESSFRAFDKKGMDTYMQYACTKPANHKFWCLEKAVAHKRRRCIVDHFEIAIANLFPRNEIAGVFAADVPADMRIPRKKFYQLGIWHQNWGYWYDHLVKTQHFPVMKTTNQAMIIRAKRFDMKLDQCVLHLDRDNMDQINLPLASKPWKKQALVTTIS